MNESQVLEMERRAWYHRIDFGDGVVAPTGSDPKQQIARMAIPDDLANLAVIDVGTRDGGLAFEFERRGAKTVIATDIRPVDFFNFQFARECLGSRVRHLHADLYKLPFLDLPKFDIVNFSGVIYHVSDPIMSLMAMRHICKPGGIIIVESAVLEGGFYELGAMAPVAARNEHNDILKFQNLVQYLPKTSVNSWVPSIAALVALCDDAGLEVLDKKAWARRCLLSTRKHGEPRFQSFYEEAPVDSLISTLHPTFL